MFGLATKRELADVERKIHSVRRMVDDAVNLMRERHDAVIELIAQIPECGCPSTKDKNPPTRPRRKAK